MVIEEVIGENYERIRSRFAVLVRDAAAVEDLTQEAFACFIAASAKGAVIEDPAAFLQGIVNKLMLGHIRRKARRKGLWERLLNEPPTHPVDRAPEQRDLQEAVRAMVEKLRPEEQAIVLGRHFLDMTMQDLSQELGLPLSTVYHRYGRAMDSLRGFAQGQGLIK